MDALSTSCQTAFQICWRPRQVINPREPPQKQKVENASCFLTSLPFKAAETGWSSAAPSLPQSQPPPVRFHHDLLLHQPPQIRAGSSRLLQVCRPSPAKRRAGEEAGRMGDRGRQSGGRWFWRDRVSQNPQPETTSWPSQIQINNKSSGERRDAADKETRRQGAGVGTVPLLRRVYLGSQSGPRPAKQPVTDLCRAQLCPCT